MLKAAKWATLERPCGSIPASESKLCVWLQGSCEGMGGQPGSRHHHLRRPWGGELHRYQDSHNFHQLSLLRDADHACSVLALRLCRSAPGPR